MHLFQSYAYPFFELGYLGIESAKGFIEFVHGVFTWFRL